MRSSCLAPCAVALVLLLLLLRAESSTATASGAAVVANCDHSDLSTACKEARVTGNPDAHCCAKLKEHEPCLCEYMKDPVVYTFVQTDKGHHIFDVCQVKYPSYCPPPAGGLLV